MKQFYKTYQLRLLNKHVCIIKIHRKYTDSLKKVISSKLLHVFIFICTYMSCLMQRNLCLFSFYNNYFQGVYHLDNHHVNHSNHATTGHSGFLCERHQKRYFFGRDSVDHVDFDEFLPPPPNLDYHNYSRQFPRDLTTQTVKYRYLKDRLTSKVKRKSAVLVELKQNFRLTLKRITNIYNYDEMGINFSSELI